MLGNRDSRGAKHRFLVLMYLSCFILSLAPTIVAPPEREFLQGQPEMHQSMDNMVSHGILVKKTGPNFAVSGAINYPALLTYKTSVLLDEAEYALRTMPNSREKQWVGAFVQRMRAIAIMLERTVERNNPYLPRMILNPMSATPVLQGLPAQSAWPAPPAVRGFNPYQRQSKMMSKYPVTSPELSQVLPDNVPSERQVVTKPAMVSNKPTDAEDDVLVRELQSLRNEVAEIPIATSKVIIPTPEFTSPATTVYPETVGANMNDVEMEKTKLKAKLLEEISMYQHLGGEIPKEVINALNGKNKDPTGPTYMQKSEPIKSGANKGMVDMLGREQLYDMNNEEKQISKPNSESLISEKSNPYNGDKQLEVQENRTFPNTQLHPNLPEFSNNFPYMSSQSKVQPYQRGLENAIENLQQPNPFNFHGNFRINQQQSHIPDALKQKMILRPENKMYNGHLPSPNYNEYMAKARYRPYAYSQYWDNSNSTVNLSPDMSSYDMKPTVNRQIDTQLNDEMKRQLRDGKIVVLSDSVVRSNFQKNPGEKVTGNENTKPKVDVNDKKNGTQTSN